jgi:hypothetical protein
MNSFGAADELSAHERSGCLEGKSLISPIECLVGSSICKPSALQASRQAVMQLEWTPSAVGERRFDGCSR